MFQFHFPNNVIAIIIIVIANSVVNNNADYWSDREEFVREDSSQSLGSSLKLNSKEQAVNEILMKLKYQELDVGFRDPLKFWPAQHFFHSKQEIEKSDVFKFIQKLPKGSSLHSHDFALVSFEYLYNLTYRDNLYGCTVNNNRLRLNFFNNVTNEECDWQLIKDLRKEDSKFDDYIRGNMTLVVDDPVNQYPSINVVWEKFSETFATVLPMITYKPVFQEYFYQSLQELYDDGVMYLEVRVSLPGVYDLDGTVYGPEQMVGLYKETSDLFKENNANFHGVRFIYAPSRSVDNRTADDYVKIARNLHRLYPDFMAGFDLVGEEDKGKPLTDFVSQLLDLSRDVKFFFHAAETDWNGETTDLNLVDAILLNTTRIGHGFGVVKHPQVLKSIKEKQIAVEISPISNQVLKLVDDLRNHPGAHLVAHGYPVVICCDDPSFWGAKALSYDWYMAFMGFSSRENDLRLLKQFALNSIIYSAMENEEKIQALKEWQVQWDRFIDEIFKLEYLGDLNSYTVHRV